MATNGHDKSARNKIYGLILKCSKFDIIGISRPRKPNLDVQKVFQQVFVIFLKRYGIKPKTPNQKHNNSASRCKMCVFGP